MILILFATQLVAATLTSTTATNCHINGAPCATVAITPHPSWAAPLEGTQWISIAQTGWPLATWLPNGTVVSFSEVFSLASMPSSAMVTFAADDSAGLWLNGALVVPEAPTAGNGYTVCSDFAPTCTAHTSVDVLPWLVAGENVLRFDVAQRGGWSYGLNYAVELTWLDEPPLSSVPEPGTVLNVLIALLALLVLTSYIDRRKLKALDDRMDAIEIATIRYRDALETIAKLTTDGVAESIARKALEE